MKIGSVGNSLICWFVDYTKGELCLSADEHVGTILRGDVKISLSKYSKRCTNIFVQNWTYVGKTKEKQVLL